MGIDPWGDLQKVQEVIQGTSTPAPSAGISVSEALDEYFDVDESGIMPLALQPSGSLGDVGVKIYGFSSTGYDSDGDEFDLKLRDNANAVPPLKSVTLNVPSSQTDIATSGGPSLTSYSGYAENRQWFLGRPGIVNGDPTVTVRTRSWNSFSGSWGMNFSSMANGDSVKAYQFQDLNFYFGSSLFLFTTYDGTTGYRYGTTGSSRGYAIATYAGAQLFINGALVGSLLTTNEVFAPASSSAPVIYKIGIQNQTITLPSETVVNDFEIRLNFNYTGASGVSLLSNGGFVPYFANPTNCIYSKNAVIYSDMDESSVNTGLLQGIIEWLSNILNSIKAIGTAIAELPGKIVSALIDGLKSLFVPDEEDFLELKTKYEGLLSERLGFVWQVGEWIVSFGEGILSAFQSGSEYVFQFPGIVIDLPDGNFTFVPSQTVDLENAAMAVVRPVAGTIVSLVCVLAFMRTAEGMLVAVVSGASYFEWLKGEDQDDN